MEGSGLETELSRKMQGQRRDGSCLSSVKTWFQLSPLPFSSETHVERSGFLPHFDADAAECVFTYDRTRLVSQTDLVLSATGRFLLFSDTSSTLFFPSTPVPLPPAERRLRVLRYLHKRARRGSKAKLKIEDKRKPGGQD